MAQDSEIDLASGGAADLRESFEADVDLVSGAPRVRIPLALPAGRRGLGPALSLVSGDEGLFAALERFDRLLAARTSSSRSCARNASKFC